jgi:exocyst complex component 6
MSLMPPAKVTYINLTRFPCVLPFSQMYPLCCIDIRNFLNQFYFFSDDHFEHSRVIDDTVKTVGSAVLLYLRIG